MSEMPLEEKNFKRVKVKQEIVRIEGKGKEK
jgi:hypothetical protein